MTWLLLVSPAALCGLALLLWYGYQSRSRFYRERHRTPAEAKLAAMQAAARIRRVTRAAENHMDQVVAERQQTAANRPYGAGRDWRWPSC